MRARKIPFFTALVITAITITACGGGERREVIQNKGSDTLVNVAQAWAEAYQTVNPTVVVAGSPLAKSYKAGLYTPLSLEDAVLQVKDLYRLFARKAATLRKPPLR